MYKVGVPGQRAEGQKQVIVVMKEDFLETIDENLGAMGFGDRSQFIRTAVLEKLAASGIDVQPIQAAPPQRTGKGGRPKKETDDAAPVDSKPEHTSPPSSSSLPRKKEKSANKKAG